MKAEPAGGWRIAAVAEALCAVMSLVSGWVSGNGEETWWKLEGGKIQDRKLEGGHGTREKCAACMLMSVMAVVLSTDGAGREIRVCLLSWRATTTTAGTQ